MNNRSIFILFSSFTVYLFAQLILLRNVVLFQQAFCFLYVAALLLVPFNVGKIMQMLLGFALGLTVDLFYDTLGIHAFATVLLAYLRGSVLDNLEPTTGYETGGRPLLPHMGLSWFATFTVPLIFVHHFAVFLLEFSELALFGRVVVRAIASTLFTFTALLITQILFYKRSRRR